MNYLGIIGARMIFSNRAPVAEAGGIEPHPTRVEPSSYQLEISPADFNLLAPAIVIM